MVKVGAATETEMKEKKHRVEDALQATRAALEEGIVPGGGVALLARDQGRQARRSWRATRRPAPSIVERALEEPLRQLAENAGLEGSVVVNEVRGAKAGLGLNVDTGEIVDMVKAGIIDPAMVTRSALQNAASIAKNILTTEAIVAEAPEKRLLAPHGRRHAGHDVGSPKGSQCRQGGHRTCGARPLLCNNNGVRPLCYIERRMKNRGLTPIFQRVKLCRAAGRCCSLNFEREPVPRSGSPSEPPTLSGLQRTGAAAAVKV